MHFDWYRATCYYGAQEVVERLLALTTGVLEPISPRNGYEAGVRIAVAGKGAVDVLWGGINEGTNVQATGTYCREFVPLLRSEFPEHSVSRVDACLDYSTPGCWEALVSLALTVADERKLQVEHVGDWHRGVKGRTLYIGSRQSVYFVRIYEKGKKEGTNPDWVRVEVEVKPHSRDKDRFAAAGAATVAFSTAWGRALWGAFNHMEPDNLIVPRQLRKGDLETRVKHMARQYGPTWLEFLDAHRGDLETAANHMTRLAIQAKYRALDSASSEASPFFSANGDVP